MVHSNKFIKYSIEEKSIKTYPYHSFKSMYRKFVSIFFILSFAYLILLSSANFTLNLISIAFSFSILFSPFLILSTCCIEFDFQNEKVYKKILGMERPICSFEEIDRIELCTNNLEGVNYKLFLKSDKFGKGQNLTPPTWKSKENNYSEFQSECLPRLMSLVSDDESEKTVSPSMHNLRFYKLKGSKVIFEKTTWLALSFFCLWSVIFIWEISRYITLSSIYYHEHPPIFYIIITIGSLAWLTKQKYFDTEKNN